MSQLSIPNLSELLATLAGQKLGDQDVHLNVLDGRYAPPIQLQEENTTFALGIGGNFEIRVFNSDDDVDEDGVLVGAGAEGPQAVLRFQGGRVWCKYRLQVGADLSLGSVYKRLGLQLTGNQAVVFSTYRVHAPHERVSEVIAQDLAQLPLVFSLPPENRFQPQEAIALQVQNSLAVQATVQWVDLLAGAFPLIQRTLALQKVTGVVLGSNLSASFSLSLADQFRLVVVRDRATTYRVSYQKARSRSVGGTVQAGVQVALSTLDVLTGLVNELMTQLTGLGRQKLEQVVGVDGVQKLGDVDRKLVQQAADRLFPEGWNENLQQLQHRWQETHAQLKGILTKAAIARAQAGFSYEYSRVRTNELVLDLSMPRPTLDKHFAALRNFQADALLHSRDPFQVHTFLKQNTLEIKQAWGFSLGLGPWTVSGKDQKQFRAIEQLNERDQKKVSVLGVRVYEAGSGGWKRGETTRYGVDFNAAMDAFVDSPRASDFRYGLFLSWEEEHRTVRKPLSEETLSEWIDLATLWRAMAPSATEGLVQTLQTTLAGAEEVRFSCQLKIEPEQFERLLPELTQPQPDAWYRALGAALPYWHDYPGRTTVAERERLYANLWKYYAEHPQTSPQHLARIAADTLQKAGFQALAQREGEYARNRNAAGEPYLFGGIARLHPQVFRDWEQFNLGLQELQTGIAQRRPYESVLRRSFEKMEEFWEQALYVRTLGFYLLERAETLPFYALLQRTVQITYRQGGAEKTWLYGA
ncbi:hypothetical protein SAMN05421823_10465 [Catalinimonas alkaloidigena]|uniref:Uncharacterized protein n=1 Tax=Catalinimonas alkaloidigena TaxID=1075417 RepID=A0A1G9GCV7_9BACT|nr:hypothetical protein [Catalinimonas alkaloidigena]SDK98401.1 hypothetical protein SAMN05421823_10465 [Catalinimonas alkaloidigena]